MADHVATMGLNQSSRIAPKIFVILGSTGSGKSKLALEIAQKIGGEIISADSMQVYRGLDIITNKVTEDEQKLSRHHMLDVVEPWQRFTVVDFRNKVLPIIENLLRRGKSAIIVGGTYYYIESILWKVLVSEQNEAESPLLFDKDEILKKKLNQSDKCSGKNCVQFRSVLQEDLHFVPNEILHKHLACLDAEIADRVHPNDRRKVIRALQVFEESGKKLSDLLNEQRSVDGGSSLGGPLRFSNVKVFWLKCDQNVLNDRLDNRVDQMISKGLIEELLNFHEKFNRHRENDEETQYTSGIFQSIGFKEFHNYLMLPEKDRQTADGEKLLNQGIEFLKIVTRRYSRKQTKWIKNRFLKKLDRPVPPIFMLDATDVNLWDEKVLKPAMEIVMDNADIRPLERTESLQNNIITFYCEECGTTVLGEIPWQSHLKSNRHKKRIASRHKKQKMEDINLRKL